MTLRFAIQSSRVLTPQGVRPAAVVIAGETINAVVSPTNRPSNVNTINFGDLVVSPGIIDSHVHVNEPGRTEWEGFATATRAAAAGGVTTIIDMPLNSSPVTTSVEALHQKQSAAISQCHVDVGFYGGLIPNNTRNIEALLDAGVCGIKAFLCDSGLDEFPASTERELREVLPLLASRHFPLLVHAELPITPAPVPIDATSYRQYAASRPRAWERAAIELLIKLCREFQAPIHVVHLADSDSLVTIEAARNDGLPLTVETCPHYLRFCEEEIGVGDTRFKCSPPIRSASDRERLWNASKRGSIDTIGSDHSPCPPDLKCLDTGDFSRAWGGIASLQLTLPTIWTGARERGIQLDRLAEWLSSNPAQLAGINRRKGQIAPGYDADLVVWNPEENWTVRGEELQHRHPITPYEGHLLWGRVKRTYLRGQAIFVEGTFPDAPLGHLLRREQY